MTKDVLQKRIPAPLSLLTLEMASEVSSFNTDLTMLATYYLSTIGKQFYNSQVAAELKAMSQNGSKNFNRFQPFVWNTKNNPFIHAKAEKKTYYITRSFNQPMKFNLKINQLDKVTASNQFIIGLYYYYDYSLATIKKNSESSVGNGLFQNGSVLVKDTQVPYMKDDPISEGDTIEIQINEFAAVSFTKNGKKYGHAFYLVNNHYYLVVETMVKCGVTLVSNE